MAIYDSRKKELAKQFGTNDCITSGSWLMAAFQDINRQITLYPADLKFLYSDLSYCAPPDVPVEQKQGIVISANNIFADVTINTIKVGTTDSVIDLAPGAYTATLSKEGYKSETLSFVVYAGKYGEKYVTLSEIEPEEEDNTYETPGMIGPILERTENRKVPNPIKIGAYNWFGQEFRNVGDASWHGMVGVELTDQLGNKFRWLGDATKPQNLAAGAIGYLWAYCLVTGSINPSTSIQVDILTTRT